jgi:hypothetical protein
MPFLVFAVACSPEYTVSRNVRVDLFVQERLDAVDVLLVVDNSRSMLEEQDHLAESFDELIGALSTGNTEWRVAVTTTETSYPEYRGVLAGGTDEVVVRASDGAELDRFAWTDREVEAGQGESLVRCADGSPRASAARPRAPDDCGPTRPPATTEGPVRPARASSW